MFYNSFAGFRRTEKDKRIGKPLPASATGDPTPDYWLRKANPGLAVESERTPRVFNHRYKITEQGRQWANFTRAEVRLLNVSNVAISERLRAYNVELNPSQVSSMLWAKLYVGPEVQSAVDKIVHVEQKRRGQK